MARVAPKPSSVRLIENAIEANMTASIWVEDMHYYTLTFPGATSGISLSDCDTKIDKLKWDTKLSLALPLESIQG